MLLDKIIKIIKSNIEAARQAARDYERPFRKFEEFEEKQQQKEQQQERQQYEQQRGQQQRQQSSNSTAQDKEAAYYAALELSKGADYAQIKAAYKRLMKQYHPDRFHGQPEKQKAAQQVSQKLNEAYEYFSKKFNL
ncbi:DnaJ domain-containing protein [Flexibacter flexilis DSM 6793]|uniref:DnaJ domain-containing protein n=1 Tax=Flexibacter flexilis DSM 6793 TaxID=927664 RepID=A0A1I1NL26_9BACT|nr:J domain-containing protein [Flexibacter flexilis]SFC98361.1 DnaJ domain-containing protein [Flexibacter flexilis DSM 6793]